MLGDILAVLPETVLALLGMVVLLAGLGRGRSPLTLGALTIGSFLLTGVTLSWVAGGIAPDDRFMFGMFAVDRFAIFFKVVVLLSSSLAVVLSLDYLKRHDYRPGEYLSLLMFATVGMMTMASGVNLAAIYVGLELMALSTYVLAGYFRREVRSHEAAAKYFVLGALSSGILLYGLSLLYGATGSLDLATISGKLAAGKPSMAAVAGMALLACGFLFKVAAVPFHMWTPDVYEGAPTPITAFMSVGPKAAAFAILLRVFAGALAPAEASWRPLMWGVAALTMVWGNIAALTQDNVKRMLAYSSIAHAGYALVGLVAGGAAGVQSVLLYMLIYTVTNLGAFGFVILLESRGYAGETVADYAGLARKHPLAAFGMLLFLLSLGGIPPTAGFMGKLYLFAAAIRAGHVWLVVIAVLMSAVSMFYYLRIVLQMYLRDGEGVEPAPLVASAWTERAIWVCALAVLVIGLFPGPFAAAAQAGLGIMPLP
ncbi:MAG: NADH-quinone oxidoreductase subunit N [Thermoanaerobaculaceae bacterium]|jgi:NADH-quinone oxidoreductase subunit N|nr:NADH-quinone oxidoreductase subunit N [Thermoanaerobaculaceae bacterium]